MIRHLGYAMALFAVALLAAPAALKAQEEKYEYVPLDGESTDNMADDLNALHLKRVQEEQARMEREVEEKNAEAMRKYKEEQERNLERWRKEQMMLHGTQP